MRRRSRREPIASRAEDDRDATPAAPTPEPVEAEASATAEPPVGEESSRRTGRALIGIGLVVVAILIALWVRSGGPGDSGPVATTAPVDSTAAARGAGLRATPPTETAGAASDVAGSEASSGEIPADAAPTQTGEPAEVAPSIAEAPEVDATAPPAGEIPAPTEVAAEVAVETPAAAAPGETTPEPSAESATPPAETGPAVPEPAWYVHVSSVKTVAGAREEAAELTRRGWSPSWASVEIPDKGTWIRLYTGPFESRADAIEAARRVKASGYTDYTRVYRLRADELTSGTGREDR
jgi:ribonuclease E